jgi:hypothetical protein
MEKELKRLDEVEKAANLDDNVDQFLLWIVFQQVSESTGASKYEWLSAIFNQYHQHFMNGDKLDEDMANSLEGVFLSEADGITWKYYTDLLEKYLAVTDVDQRPFSSLADSLDCVRALGHEVSPVTLTVPTHVPEAGVVPLSGEAPVVPGAAVATPALAAQLKANFERRLANAPVTAPTTAGTDAITAWGARSNIARPKSETLLETTSMVWWHPRRSVQQQSPLVLCFRIILTASTI